METKLTLDTNHYEERDFTLGIELPSIVARALDVPEQFVACQKMDDDWYFGRSEDDEILVRLLKVYDEGENDEMNKMCDFINSSSFLTKVNSEINKIEKLADGKVTMKSNSEPTLTLQTGKDVLNTSYF